MRKPLKCEKTTELCIKLNIWASRASSGKHFKRAPYAWEKKGWWFFADRVGFKGSCCCCCFFVFVFVFGFSIFENVTAPARTWSNHNIATYKFQYSWRARTLPVQGRESYLTHDPVSSCRRVTPSRNNLIEFQRGNKLPATSSEALLMARSNVTTKIMSKTKYRNSFLLRFGPFLYFFLLLPFRGQLFLFFLTTENKNKTKQNKNWAGRVGYVRQTRFSLLNFFMVPVTGWFRLKSGK